MKNPINKRKYVIHVIGMNSTKFGALEHLILSLADSLGQHNIGLIVLFNSIPRSEAFLQAIKEHPVKLVASDAFKPFQLFRTLAGLFLKYDIIAIHSHFQPLFTGIIGWFCGCKQRWVTLHMMLMNDNFEEITDAGELKFSTRLHHKLIQLFATKLLAVSQQVNDQYCKIYPGASTKCQTFYLGIDANTFNREDERTLLHFDNETVYLATVGFANPVKGFDILLDAAALLINKENIKNIKFCMIGLDDHIGYTKFLKDFAKANLPEENVIWFGIKDNVPELLSAMDIYVQPSRSEAISFSIMEAEAAGIPCIASDVGGIKEAIIPNKTGFLFRNKDSHELAEYLKRLIQDDTLRKEYGINSKDFVLSHFNRRLQVEKLCEMYLS
jgi:glycosyltransferase involved in cell wall biosynthesis